MAFAPPNRTPDLLLTPPSTGDLGPVLVIAGGEGEQRPARLLLHHRVRRVLLDRRDEGLDAPQPGDLKWTMCSPDEWPAVPVYELDGHEPELKTSLT